MFTSKTTTLHKLMIFLAKVKVSRAIYRQNLPSMLNLLAISANFIISLMSTCNVNKMQMMWEIDSAWCNCRYKIKISLFHRNSRSWEKPTIENYFQTLFVWLHISWKVLTIKQWSRGGRWLSFLCSYIFSCGNISRDLLAHILTVVQVTHFSYYLKRATFRRDYAKTGAIKMGESTSLIWAH